LAHKQEKDGEFSFKDNHNTIFAHLQEHFEHLETPFATLQNCVEVSRKSFFKLAKACWSKLEVILQSCKRGKK
jgi:hypothetical protein